MQLPESLSPWRQWLEWFTPGQLPLFADFLGRLNPLLGPLRGMHQGGVPEPEGLGNLQRRGPYERLLTSEWLLAEEVPDEFLRRAVAGEHLFLAPQYRARQANRLIIVLFDAGPLQLGGPRLVHLALLILLARRAKEAGAQLRWGILQEVPQLYALDSSAQLKQLLAARTYLTVSEEHWKAWRTWLSEQQQDEGERWLVGQRLPATDKQSCTHRVQLQRSLDGRSLMFELQATTTHCVTLPNPGERLALQLIKGQFEAEVAVRPVLVKDDVPRVGLTHAPIISGHGSHVALRMLDEHGLVAIKLPAPQQKKAVEVRRSIWSAGSTPLAITFPSRVAGAILSDGSRLTFWNMPGLKPVSKPGRDDLHLPLGTATFLPTVWLRNASSGRVFILDTHGHLAYWVIDTGKLPARPEIGKTHRLTDKVLGLAQVDREAMAYLRSDGGRIFAHCVDAWGTVSPGHTVSVAEGVSQVLFAASPLWRRSFGGCALLRVNDRRERWQVIGVNGQTEQIDLAPGWKGLGLYLQEGDEHYSLVLMSPNQQTIALYNDGQQRIVFTTSQVIAKVSFCPMSGLIAALTCARELLVYSVPLDLMRLQTLCNHQPATSRDDEDA